MRPSTFKIIIFLSSFALLGLVITQTYWIREDMILASKQFDHRADNALKEVVDELRDQAYSTSRFFPHTYACTYLGDSTDIINVLDTVLLKSLLERYISYHRLDDNYYFAVVKSVNDSIIYRSSGFPAENKLSKPYKACLSSIWKDAHFHLALYFPQKNRVIFLEQVLWLGLTLLFLVIIIWGVSAIIITYLRQKKLSEMKNDFVNNITHEFKTPVSTIALAAEVLMKPETKSHPEKINNYAKIIFDENQRMREQIERVLEIAQQDHHEIKLEPVDVDIHKLLKNVISSLSFEENASKVTVHYQLQASNPVIHVDLMYIKGIISNIVENALKYSVEEPVLNIITGDLKEGILISFIDNGIGINRESMKLVFDKFYRVPTGNIHNVKGFGLGLYLAKTMVEAHGGYIEVTSELNKGSRFDVYLPAHFNSKKDNVS
jgi:two-component system phosphate regulon sensor histidine kinase PhoR